VTLAGRVGGRAAGWKGGQAAPPGQSKGTVRPRAGETGAGMMLEWGFGEGATSSTGACDAAVSTGMGVCLARSTSRRGPGRTLLLASKVKRTGTIRRLMSVMPMNCRYASRSAMKPGSNPVCT